MKISDRSVLRYPGGKYRARKILEEQLPKNTQTILSPFFGGGSFELYLSGRGIRTLGHDKFFVLANFWEQLEHYPQSLAEEIQRYFGKVDSTLFKELQAELTAIEQQGTTDNLLQAAAKFLIVNRCSFSGATLSGGYSQESSKSRFTQSIIDKIARWNNPHVSVTCANAHDALQDMPDVDLLFLDPPYLLEEKKNKLYGISGSMHKDFDHVLFQRQVSETDKPFLLTYNNTDEIHELWKDFSISEAIWAYGMNKSKTSSEVLIKNY